MWVDGPNGRVAVDGRVCLREGVLEMFACPTNTKEHESVVAVDAPAFLLHTALLAIGAEPGKPVRFEPEFRPPSGPRIEVTVAWTDADGEARTASAQSWIRDTETGAAMKLPFVFAGSGFWTDPDSGRQRYLADAGDLICVSNFGTAMLDVPVASTQANGELLFEPFTERIPPIDTPVRLWLKVKREPTALGAAEAPSTEIADAIAAVQAAPAGAGATDALQRGWRRLAAATADELPQVLGGFQAATPQAENWLRTAFDAAAERAAAEGALPIEALLRFAANSGNTPRARRTAYETVAAADPDAGERLLDAFVDDPSMELRFDAIARLLSRAEAADAADRVALFRTALRSARALPQIEAAAEGLEAAEQEVDLIAAVGFVADWRLIGPFDNRDEAGFDVAYPPESELDAAAVYDGKPDKEGEPIAARWVAHRSDDRLGEINLNAALKPYKGAVAYAWATVESDAGREIEVRYTSRVATKVWVNGDLVAENEIYHGGSGFDQHRAAATLKPGANTVLVKACQNEQTEPWAQSWYFQLRLCDELGGALAGLRVLPAEELNDES